MYTFRKFRTYKEKEKRYTSTWFVIHKATGTTAPCTCRCDRKYYFDLPSYKQELFFTFFMRLTRAERSTLLFEHKEYVKAAANVPKAIIDDIIPDEDSLLPPIIGLKKSELDASIIKDIMFPKVQRCVSLTNKEDTTMSEEIQKRSYLSRRLSDIRYDKKNDLRKQYHIDSDPAPTTVKEAKERLTSGKFTFGKLPDEYKFDYFDDARNCIEWRSAPADTEGFNKAKETLETEYTKATDQVMVADIGDALKAVQSFETFTIQ